MRFLLSTMTNFILWEGKASMLLRGKLENGFAHYHGISWDNDWLYVAGAYNFNYVIHRLDPSTFEVNDIIEGTLHEVHQIFHTGERLFVVNTGKNRIEIWEDDKGWRNVAFKPSSCDIDHLNGIWMNCQLAYVSEFRHKSEGPSVVRICDHDLNLLETVEMGRPIHNVYEQNGWLFSLASRPPCGILMKSLSSGVKQQVKLPQLEGMLLRGLAKSKDHWYIGASRWETERDKRHVGDAIILILDNDFVEVDKIVIKDAGPVCSIRLVDEPDLAHNGIPYPGEL